MLENRNKLHMSKLLLDSWLVLSYLLVKQWHLKIWSWLKHPVWMLDEVYLHFFSKQFFWKKTCVVVFELWGAASSVPTWKGMWGWLRDCRHCSTIQAYPLHGNGKAMQSASASHPLLLLYWWMLWPWKNCFSGLPGYWHKLGGARIFWSVGCSILVRTWAESYREGWLGGLGIGYGVTVTTSS